MIPVTPQHEPSGFQTLVREPGIRFLTEFPNPTDLQWKNKAFWQKVLPDMRVAYGGICAYSATWIPHSTGNHSIDHFASKSQHPELAYEWDNYRYVSARFNSRKGTRKILDPFLLAYDWFIMDFASFLIKPNPALSIENKNAVSETIDYLWLNKDEDLVNERYRWVMDFYSGEILFLYLKRNVPFIAYELERQGLV